MEKKFNKFIELYRLRYGFGFENMTDQELVDTVINHTAYELVLESDDDDIKWWEGLSKILKIRPSECSMLYLGYGPKTSL